MKAWISSYIRIIDAVDFSKRAQLSIINKYCKARNETSTVIQRIFPHYCHSWNSSCDSGRSYCLWRSGAWIKGEVGWFRTITVEVYCKYAELILGSCLKTVYCELCLIGDSKLLTVESDPRFGCSWILYHQLVSENFSSRVYSRHSSVPLHGDSCLAW